MLPKNPYEITWFHDITAKMFQYPSGHCYFDTILRQRNKALSQHSYHYIWAFKGSVIPSRYTRMAYDRDNGQRNVAVEDLLKQLYFTGRSIHPDIMSKYASVAHG